MGSTTDLNDPQTRRIRHDIDRTQREMSDTIEEIERRFSPHYLMEQTRDSVRRAGVNTSRRFIDRVKDHPIPAAMIGAGIFLLMRDSGTRESEWRTGYPIVCDVCGATQHDTATHRALERSRGAASRLSDTASSAAEEIREKASDLADNVSEKASDIVYGARERASELADAASRRADVVRDETRDLFNDSPLVIALGAIAVGAVVAALIPETEKEREMMGQTADRVVDRTKDLAREGVDRAKHVAQAAADTAKETAKTEARQMKAEQNLT